MCCLSNEGGDRGWSWDKGQKVGGGCKRVARYGVVRKADEARNRRGCLGSV